MPMSLLSIAKAVIKSLVVAAFMAILLLPVTQMLTGWLPSFPLSENRTLAPWPRGSLLRSPTRFVAEAQGWFQDHYGLRDILVRAKTQIDYSLFGVSDHVYIGPDGWLFYRTVVDQEEPAIAVLSDADLDRVIGKFIHLRDVLAARGMKLIVITNELKPYFYARYLPAAIDIEAGTRRFAQFKSRMRQVPGIQYIDTTPILKRLMTRRQIFPRTDFHWNDPAGFEVAGLLADMIAADQNHPAIWDHVLKIDIHDFSGGQANFLPLFYIPHEPALFVVPTWPLTPVQTIAPSGPFEWVQKRQPAAGKTLLDPVVWFGDSFSDAFFQAGLTSYFSEFDRARIYSTRLSGILGHMPPDARVFVFQFIDTELPALSLPAAGPME